MNGLTVHLIGEKRTFLQFPLAQTRDGLAFVLPVITEHSLVKCASIRTFGSSPTGIATGVLHKGPLNKKSRSINLT